MKLKSQLAEKAQHMFHDLLREHQQQLGRLIGQIDNSREIMEVLYHSSAMP